MAMSRYNSKQQQKVNAESGTYGSAKMKLFVTIKNDTYIVDEFKSKAKCNFYKGGKIIGIEKEENIWYSFDQDSGNFHIMPDESIEIKIECEDSEEISLYKKLDCIREKVKGKVQTKRIWIGPGKEENTNECIRNHKYICAYIEKTDYLMSFNRLWCDVKTDGIHICNNFGQAQFMCFPREIKNGSDKGNINRFPNKEFKMMYPRSAEDGELEGSGRHLVFNTPYDINSDVEKIAKCFAEFIRLCEELCEKDTEVELCKSDELLQWCEETKQTT